MMRPEFKQYDDVYFNGVRSKIVGVNPTSKTFNVRSANSLAQGIEAKDLFATYEEWQSANPNDPLNKPVDLLAWHRPPVAPRPDQQPTRKLTINPKTEEETVFDYASLEVEARIVVQQKTSEIRERIDGMKRSAVEIGQRLIEAKTYLNHGQWGAWLRTEFDWSQDTAERLMNVSRMTVQNPQIAEYEDRFQKMALVALAAKSTPPTAIQIAVERVQELPLDVQLTHSEAKEIIAEAKAAEPEVTVTSTGALVDENGEILNRDIPIAAPEVPHKHIPMTNRTQKEGEESPAFDRCQTPAKALDPLLPYLLPNWVIWEPARGEGLLVEGLYDAGFKTVLSGDVLTGQDFFKTVPDEHYDAHVTNPPYSVKYQWMARCYKLGKPFALLLPVGTLGAMKAQVLFKHFGVEIILLDQRINFKMPEKGWDGNGSQFSTAWFTWGLHIGATHTYAHIPRKGEADE